MCGWDHFAFQHDVRVCALSLNHSTKHKIMYGRCVVPLVTMESQINVTLYLFDIIQSIH